MSLLESAQDALRRGLLVFPCNPRGKEPFGKLVPNGSIDASADPAQIFSWWSEHPGCNVGVRGGVICDVDSGLRDIQDAREFSLKHGFPPTLWIRTGRRDSFGIQFHFSGQAVSGNYSAHGVSGEIRSGNLYGIIAGIHPVSGERYEIVRDEPIAPCPENILGEFRTDRARRVRTDGTSTVGADAPIDIWTAKERFYSLLFRAAHAAKGSRHACAHAVAWYSARAFLAGVFEEQKVCGVLLYPAMTEADVKMEIFRAVKSRYARGERDLRRMLRDSWESGLVMGRLELELYAEDVPIVQSCYQDIRFARAWDGDCSDFNGAVETRAFMARLLTEAGCQEVDRVLRASRIDEMVEVQLEFERRLRA